MRAAAVWAAVADERRRLASDLEAAAERAPDLLDHPSECAGWAVRDVVGHLLFLAEHSPWTLLATSARTHPRPNVAIDRLARSTGAGLAAPEAAARLRAAAGGRGRVPGLPPIVVLGEVLTHRSDIAGAGAAGLPPLAPTEGLRAVLTLYRRLYPVFGVRRAVRRYRIEPDGAGWYLGPAAGPRIGGSVEDVLLTVTGRHPLPAAAWPRAR